MNWKQAIADLESTGLTQVEIGQAVGCSQSQVSDLKTGRRGKRLNYDVGLKLQKLWESRCKQKRKA